MYVVRGFFFSISAVVIYYIRENETMKQIYTGVTAGDRRLTIASVYREAGPVLVLFIHGLGCAKESFEGAFRAPALSGFSLLAPDLAGFGRSQKPVDFSYRMEAHADVLGALLRRIGAGEVHIVAHSMGGAVGLLLSKYRLRNTASFTSVEGNLFPEDCGLMSRKAASTDFRTFKEEVFERLRENTKRRYGEPFSQWLAESSPEGFYRSAVSLVRWTDSGRLFEIFSGLRTIRYYLYGERSVRPHSVLSSKGIGTVRVPESGHFPMIDNPEAFYDLVAGIVTGTGV